MRSNGTGIDVPIFSSPIDRKVRRHAHKTIGAVDIGTRRDLPFISSTVTPAATVASSAPTARNVTVPAMLSHMQTRRASGNGMRNVIEASHAIYEHGAHDNGLAIMRIVSNRDNAAITSSSPLPRLLN